MSEGRARATADRAWGGRAVGRTWLALLLVVAALMVSGAARADATLDRDESLTAWCERRVLAPFRSYTHRHEIGAWDEPDGDPSVAASFPADTAAMWTDVRSALGSTAVLVATVPDPIDTGYVYQFEGVWSAVELGVEQHRYLRDQTWLPWEDAHVARKETRPIVEACRLRVPGALLLRRNETARADAGGKELPDTIVVLFVGETPAEGVHKGTLARAFELARDLETFAPGNVRVVGPTYSGSAHSLRATVDAMDGGLAGTASADDPQDEDAPAAGARSAVEIVSGSATTRSIGSLLTEDAGARGELRFRRTTIDDTSIEQLFFPWLERRGRVLFAGMGRPNRVGLLAEEGTLFGVSQAATAAATTHPAIILQFRRGIAGLERAHATQQAQVRAQEATAAAPPPIEALSTVLDPSFDERVTPRDSSLDPSPKRLAALDLELRNLLTEVSREGLTYLAIRATDSADAVFLAQQVRAVAPDVRLIFFASDILLLHPSFATQFRGSLVVTPYPFFGTSDLSNPGSQLSHEHRPWESQQAEGTYNATVGLLMEALHDGELADLAEYAPLSATDGGAEGCEGNEPLLPLWVAAIGTGTIFPIDVIAPQSTCRPSFFSACPTSAPPAPSDERDQHDAGEDARCSASAVPLGSDWTLRVDEDITPPRGWAFLLFFTGILAILETIRFFNTHPYWGGARDERGVRTERTSLSRLRETTLARYVAKYVDWVAKRYDDRPDLALLRAKYLRYAAVRGAVLTTAYAYMVSVHVLALRTEPLGELRSAPWWRHTVMALSVLIMLYLFASAAFRILLSVIVDVRAAKALAPPPAPGGSPKERRLLGRAVADIARGRPPCPDNALGLHLIHAGALHVLVVMIAFLGLWRSWFDLPAFWTWRTGPLPAATAEGVSFVLRALPLASGVSAAVVVVLLATALVTWMTYGMRRVALTHGLCLITPTREAPPGAASTGSVPSPGVAPPLVGTPIAYIIEQPDLVALEERVQHVLQRPAAYRRSVLTSAVVLLVPVGAFFLKPPTSLEAGGDTLALVLLLCVVTFIAAITTQHLVEFWFAFRALLDRLRDWNRSSIFPLAVPFVGATVSRLVTRRYKETEELLLCAELARKVVSTTGKDEVERTRAILVAGALGTTDGDLLRGRDLGRALLVLARNACRGSFRAEEEAIMPVSSPRGAEAATAAGSDPNASPQAALVACVLGVLLNRYVRHMRHFMTGTSICAVLIVLVIAGYPFEPHRLLMTCAWILTLAVVGAGVGVYLGMERSAVLSFLSGTAPTENQFSREIVVRIVTWIALPLASVFAAQYPQFGHLVATVLDPISSAFR